MPRNLLLILLALAFVATLAHDSSAQGYAPARNARRPLTFSRPTVSPYLNLVQFDDGTQDAPVPVYQTLVRPFLDQRRLNQYQAYQVYQLQQQVARSASQAPQGETSRQTGHFTSYQNLSHFYPALSRPPR